LAGAPNAQLLAAVQAGDLQGLAQQLLGSLNLGPLETPEDAQRAMMALQQQLSGALGALGETLLTQAKQEDLDSTGILLKRQTPIDPEDSEVRELIVLPDQSVVIHTSMVEGAVDLADWAAEHDDPRGVPVFPPARLESLRTAKSYDDALRMLGEEVFFVPMHEEQAGDDEDDEG
jgi:hypothetical protein